MIRVLVSGLLLIANLFLFTFYNAFDSSIVNPHPFSSIEYGLDTYVFLLHLYSSSLVYVFIAAVLKPVFKNVFGFNLWHFYVIFEVMKVVDFILFYDWTFINIDIVGSFLIGVTIVYILLQMKHEK